MSEILHDQTAAKTDSAITEWCDDVQWDAEHPDMGVGLRNRLKSANRAVFALRGIVTMLVQDERGKDAMRDHPDEVHFRGLSSVERETLSVAAMELARESERYLSEIRERDHQCIGVRP